MGRRLGLDACVVLDRGRLDVSRDTMATKIKAIIGAVQLDGGDAAVGPLLDRLGLIHPLLQVVTLQTPSSLLCEQLLDSTYVKIGTTQRGIG